MATTFLHRAKPALQRLLAMRIPPNRLYRLLAWEYWGQRVAFNELRRMVYFQPMFESLCGQVGPGLHLNVCPDSKIPMLFNCQLQLGARVTLSARTTFSGARNAPTPPVIRIGDDSYIGDRCVFRAGQDLIIGKHVLIATGGLIAGDPGHPLDATVRRTSAAPAQSLGRIEIGDDVWCAYNVSILGNVKVGEGAVLAAGAVVTHDVPPFSLVAGNPARVIRSLRPGAFAKTEVLTLETRANALRTGAPLAGTAGLFDLPPPQ